MPAPHRYIDPETRDYVIEAGEPKGDPTAATVVYLALATKRGTCIVLPWLGSRFHEIRKLTSDAPRLFEQYAIEAVAHLVKRGRIRSVAARATVEGSHVHLIVSFKDRVGRTQHVPYTVEVG